MPRNIHSTHNLFRLTAQTTIPRTPACDVHVKREFRLFFRCIQETAHINGVYFCFYIVCKLNFLPSETEFDFWDDPCLFKF